MAYEWNRLIWWLQHDGSAVATLVKAGAAILTTAITALLGLFTYKYMALTRQLAAMATEQVRAAVRPAIKARVGFRGARDSVGGDIFKDEATVELTNVGSSPLVTSKVYVEWEH